MVSDNTIRIFDGATAIVTGGASGIGRALAEELARRGSGVVLADLQIELADEVAAKIQASGGKAKAVNLNVTDFTALERLVQETVEHAGRIDYIFNNAGVGIGGTVHHYGIDDWNYIIDVNFRGVVNGVQAAYKIMMRQGFGHIISTASAAGIMPSPASVAYAATKHAVVGLSTSLRAEAAPLGIRVSVICPGVVRTPILEGGKYGRMLVDIPPDKLRQLWEKLNPMPADIFAVKVLNSVSKNRAIIVVPARWKLFWLLNRLFPAFGIFLAQKHFQKMQKELDIV